ncbi:hypothetical protein BMS3Bbin02_00839 [bacterium BMS3Bbin02]|nr:hypothetical protein BMS3Bbin02_00839 [bacterium BMS3Bbin02]
MHGASLAPTHSRGLSVDFPGDRFQRYVTRNCVTVVAVGRCKPVILTKERDHTARHSFLSRVGVEIPIDLFGLGDLADTCFKCSDAGHPFPQTEECVSVVRCHGVKSFSVGLGAIVVQRASTRSSATSKTAAFARSSRA